MRTVNVPAAAWLAVVLSLFAGTQGKPHAVEPDQVRNAHDKMGAASAPVKGARA